jgi:hypothetical protein
MEQLREMANLIARNTAGDGIFSTAIQRLTLIRSSRPTLPMPNVYEPALCLVAQGRKQAMLNGRTFTYDPARYLIVSVELPILGRVVEASPEEPYLCLALNFDPVALSELVMQIPAPEGASPPLGMTLCDASPPLLDAAIRLLRLLDDGLPRRCLRHSPSARSCSGYSAVRTGRRCARSPPRKGGSPPSAARSVGSSSISPSRSASTALPAPSG